MIYHAEKLRDGRFVYVTSGNTVFELEADGKVARQLNLGAIGNTSGWSSVERLPGGNYLVALYSNNKVVEVDAAGKVLWECKAANPGHATRLRNGNTLVANIEGRTVVEYDRAGKEVWSVKAPGRPFHAWRR
jgi:outer membrane protein assembly factor BamB